MSTVIPFPVHAARQLQDVVGTDMAKAMTESGETTDEAVADLVVELLEVMTPAARRLLVEWLPRNYAG